MLYETDFESPVGTLRIISSGGGLRAVLWPDDDPRRVAVDEPTVQQPAHPHLVNATRQLAEYFAGERTTFDVDLEPCGTDFQLTCWNALSAIPYGTTISYGEQARMIGRPRAVRAVGGANGRNPLSIFVPCHRVVAADGALTGFAGGTSTKRWLIEHEARHRT